MGVRCLIDGGPTELTRIGSNQVNSSGGAVTPHANTQAGDMLILLDGVNDPAPSNTGTPSGWLPAFSFLVQTDCRLRCHVALATAGIISSGVLPLQAAGSGVGAAKLFTLRPDVPITGFNFWGSPAISFSALTMTLSHNVDVETEQGPLVVVSLAQHFAAVLASTPAFDVAESFGILDFGLAVQNSSPVDHLIDTTGALNAEANMASTWISVF